MNGRNHHADLSCDLLAQSGHSARQLPAVFDIDNREQAMPDLQFESVEIDKRAQRFLFGSSSGSGSGVGSGWQGLARLAARQSEGQACESEERDEWHARQKADAREHHGGMLERARLPEDLCAELGAKLRTRAGTRDNDTGRGGNQEGRDLADQTIADGEDGEGLDRARQ